MIRWLFGIQRIQGIQLQGTQASDEQAKQISIEIDRICAKWRIDYEEFIRVQALLAEMDAAKQKDPLVKSVLEAMACHLKDAAFNYYASWK